MSEDSIVSPRDKVGGADAAWSARTWLSVVSLTVATFALVFSEFLPAGLLTPMASGLAISEGLAGQAVTATALTGAVSALLVGLVIGRIDRKAVMLFFCLLCVASSVAAATAPNFAVLLAARLVLGIAIGGFWTLVAAVVARLVSIEAIGRGMSIIFIGVSAATICAPPLGALIAEAFGWRAAFLVGGGAALLALVIEFVTLPKLPATDPVRLGTLVEMSKRPMVRIGLLAVVAIAAGHFAGFTYVRPVLETVTHLSPTVVAGVLLAFGLANFVGNLAGGALADRNLRLGLFAVGALLGLTTLGLAVFGAQAVLAAAFVTVWGFAFGGAPIVLQTWMARAAPDHLESVGGLFIATFQISIALGAAVGGAVVDGFGVGDAMLVTALLGLGAAALAGVRLETVTAPAAAE